MKTQAVSQHSKQFIPHVHLRYSAATTGSFSITTEKYQTLCLAHILHVPSMLTMHAPLGVCGVQAFM